MASSSTVIGDFPRHKHNHRRCVADALAAAQRVCEQRGARLTAIRRRVLELVWASHEPVVAYDLLEHLRPDKPNATPPTVYRALEFLLEHRLIHRIESLNAYVGCADPELDHSCQFFICSSCGAAAEIDAGAIDRAVASQAKALGFAVSATTIEVTGVCVNCDSGKRA